MALGVFWLTLTPCTDKRAFNWLYPRVGPECLCPRIDPLRFMAGCRRRRLNQGLVVALGFLSLLDRACFCVIFLVYGCMLCLICYLFVISTSVIDCLGRFVPKMTYYVSSEDVKPCSTQLNFNWLYY